MRGLALPVDPNVIVGLAPADDAAVVRLGPALALVFTTDFFTPLVDDPRDFGRIAATNALSDVYAMGATPLVALNIVAFPTKTLGLGVLAEVLAGGGEVAQAAGISIAGGHSVEDAEPKYGLAVIGTVHPDSVWRKGGMHPGDALVLTKALGTGIVATALKRDRVAESDPIVRAAVAGMTTLNAEAARVARTRGAAIHAATDVTGYGLVGHLGEMLRATGGVGAVLDAAALPLLDGARALAEAGVLPGGTRANRAAAGDAFVLEAGVDEALAWIACDAQTSGGLLLAMPPDDAAGYADAMRALGHPAAVIGRVVASPEARITLR